MFGSPAARPGHAARVAGRLRPLPVARAHRPRLVGRPASSGSIRRRGRIGATVPSFAVSFALAGSASRSLGRVAAADRPRRLRARAGRRGHRQHHARRRRGRRAARRRAGLPRRARPARARPSTAASSPAAPPTTAAPCSRTSSSSGLPVDWGEAEHDRRVLVPLRRRRADHDPRAAGDPWTPEDARGWAARGLAAPTGSSSAASRAPTSRPRRSPQLARDRRLLDRRPGARRARAAPARSSWTPSFDPEVLRHATRAQARRGGGARRSPAPSSRRTLRGARRARGRRHVRLARLAGRRRRAASSASASDPSHSADPTGAGDAYCVAYLDARATGHSPGSAARRASALVSGLLLGRAR